MPLLLEGRVDTRDQTIETLSAQLRQAQLDLQTERRKTATIEAGVRGLRQQLTPLYQALQSLFGDIDAMGVAESSSSTSGPDPRKQAIWESWKAKLPSGEGRAIDALLLHGTMTTAQLRIHVGCASRTAQNIVTALKSKGLIVKNGPHISLKEM